MINTFLYMTFYALMKMLHRERVHLFVWLLVVVSISTWVPNLSFSPALFTALDMNVAACRAEYICRGRRYISSSWASPTSFLRPPSPSCSTSPASSLTTLITTVPCHLLSIPSSFSLTARVMAPDIWHFLSAVGLASVAMLCYVLDFGLEYVVFTPIVRTRPLTHVLMVISQRPAQGAAFVLVVV